MAQPQKKRNGSILKTVVLAAVSLGMYVALFKNQSTVLEFFTKGGIYAALPVTTALVFSFVHSAFASQCLETLGITAKKTPTASQTVTKQKQSESREDKRQRLQFQ